MRVPTRLLRGVLFFVASLFALNANALPERPVSVDMGFGLPQLIALQGQVAPSPHWQIGLSYGLIPGVSPTIKLPSQDASLADGLTYSVVPTVKANFFCLTPFVRYYPAENNFYIQLAYAMFHLKMDVTSAVTSPGTSLAVGYINGTIDVVQALPTLSIGHVFSGKIYFFNINLGFTFIANVSTDVALQSLLPDALGGSTGNEAEMAKMKSKFNESANEAANIYRSQYSVIPSIMLSFGLIL